MATFITLLNFTEQGIRNVKESPDRYRTFKAMAEKRGITIKSAYWTVGHYDIVVVVDGPEEAVASVLLKLGSLGNVRTQTLRGYSEEEMRQIISNMP